MRSTTRRPRVRPLKKGASEEEIVRWTTKHDVFERVEAGVSEVIEDHEDLERILDEALGDGNTSQLNMRLPKAMKAVLGRLARERTTDSTTLARIWLAERIRKELRNR
jgi:hypothetical protein